MPTFQINLIRNRPVPLPQRRPMALALLLYLLVSGSVLAWAVHQATREVQAARLQTRLIREQSQRFLSMRKGWRSLDAYAQSLRRQMGQAGATLGTVGQLLRKRLPVAHLLRDLAAPLPDNVHLINIEIDQAGGMLRFDLAIPMDAPDGTPNMSAILSAWRSAPLLKRAAADLRERSSQQSTLKGSPVFLMHFEAALQEGI